MKKLLSCLLLASFTTSLFASCDSCECDATGKSYLNVHPQGQSFSPEYFSGFKSDRLHAKEDGRGGTFQFVIMGGSSTKSKDLARYFLPFCKEELKAGSQIAEAPQQNDFDIYAPNFNVFTQNDEFLSEFSIRPKQSVVGFLVHYRQSFMQNEEKGSGFWASISFPVLRVKNDMNFCETIINDGGGADESANTVVVANMKEAFQQNDWLYGKIASCSLSETKVADVEFKLGYEWLEHKPYHLESYIGFVAPGGNTPDAAYLWQPIVGNGHHVAFIWGARAGMDIWESEAGDRELRMEYGMQSEYLFSRRQKRSLDLKNKPWSRYLPVYADQAQAQEANNLLATNAVLAANLNTPGINVFTQSVKVTPRYQHDLTWALCYKHCEFDLEGGFSLFARQAECLKLDCPWQETVALKARIGGGATEPIRDITGNPFIEEGTCNFVSLANYDNSIIKASDLDLNSAATPAIITYNIYGSFGYNWDMCEYPSFINAGGSYEFSGSNNAVLNRWLIWVKAGLSF